MEIHNFVFPNKLKSTTDKNEKKKIIFRTRKHYTRDFQKLWNKN